MSFFRQFQADILLFLVTAQWGITFVVVADAQKHSDTFTFLALRFLVAGLASLLLARKALWQRDIWKVGLLLSGPMFLGFVFQTMGLRYTTPSRSAFLTGLAVVLVPFLSWFFMKKAPKPFSLIGVAMAAWGLYWLTGGLDAGASTTAWGDFLTVLCALSFGLHIALNEKYAPNRSASGLVAVQMWVLSLLSFGAMQFVSPHVEWTPGFIGAVLFCGVFASTVAFSVSTWAQARTPAVRAALIFSLEPVFAAMYSVGLGKETLSAREIIGGALILGGVVVAEAGAWVWARAQASR